ncbi:hypothetical protein F0365_01815 [Nonlabens sp. Ci31]|uniref:hypothetical protein n=1 Tax=Nonlabens sp. Ci31 TaxID=2608253 RepID=UPI001462E7AE|nr:hypothetical protein [Nonlabens sp. Ci31]QJP33234.1 hypothetical protein F0365_01815 [Nonlabens sp. Ci31]
MNKRLLCFITSFRNSSINWFILKTSLYLFIFLMLSPYFGSAQVGINTDTIDPYAILQIESTDKGVLFPRLSIADRDAITAAAAATGNPVPSGLTIYCTDCCQNGTGSIYYYNGVAWKSLDNSCRDVNAPPACIDLTTTITDENHMESGNNSDDTPALLIDGNTVLAAQTNNERDKLEMHKTDKDNVAFDFSENLPVGYKIRLYFNDSQRPANGGGFRLGLDVSPELNGVQTGQNVDTENGTLPNSTVTSSGNDHILTMTLNSITDHLKVVSSNDDRDHVYLLEIKLFDNNDVEIPLTCN